MHTSTPTHISAYKTIGIVSITFYKHVLLSLDSQCNFYPPVHLFAFGQCVLKVTRNFQFFFIFSNEIIYKQ